MIYLYLTLLAKPKMLFSGLRKVYLLHVTEIFEITQKPIIVNLAYTDDKLPEGAYVALPRESEEIGVTWGNTPSVEPNTPFLDPAPFINRTPQEWEMKAMKWYKRKFEE